ncbi:unnamed protein product [Gadus morhua 'NCC']
MSRTTEGDDEGTEHVDTAAFILMQPLRPSWHGLAAQHGVSAAEDVTTEIRKSQKKKLSSGNCFQLGQEEDTSQRNFQMQDAGGPRSEANGTSGQMRPLQSLHSCRRSGGH